MKCYLILHILLLQIAVCAQSNSESKVLDRIPTSTSKTENQTVIKDISTPPIVPASVEGPKDPLKPVTEVMSTPVSIESSSNQEQTIQKEKPLTEEIIVEKPNGSINWSQQYIEARGQTAIDYEKFKNKAQAKLMATRGAMVVAQRNLLEIVKGVEIVGETKVEDMITTYDYIYTRVEGKIKGAKQVGIAIEKDGIIEVTVRMPLYSKNGIASIFGDKEIAQAQLKNGYTTNLMPQNSGSDILLDPNKPLVFNLNGKMIDLSLFPVIVDDNGNVQFDFSKLINTKTGEFPKYLQLGKEIMKDLGYEQGVNVIDIIQSGKGEFKLPNKKVGGKFWQTLGNIAKTTGKILFNLPFK